MIPAASFAGKHVSLFGLGGSGIATARALIEGGAQVLAWDDNPDSVAKASTSAPPSISARAVAIPEPPSPKSETRLPEKDAAGIKRAPISA